MHFRTRYLSRLVIIVIYTGLPPAPNCKMSASPIKAHGDSKATQILVQGRQSTGVARVQLVRSLIAFGTFTKIADSKIVSAGDSGAPLVQMDTVGTFHMVFLPPNRYRQDYTTLLKGRSPVSTLITTRNGETFWLANRRPEHPSAGLTINLKDPASPTALQQKSIKFLQIRYQLALWLYADPAFPLSFVSRGVAQVAGFSASVVECTGPEGFESTLYFNDASHKLMVLTYTEALTGRKEELRINSYREWSGIEFPQLISRRIEGVLKEELRFDNYQINEPLNESNFTN